MEKIDQLIHAKWIITGENPNRILENHALALANEKIIAILPSETAKQQYQPTDESHFRSHALLPGFINSHTHLAMALFRGLADDLDLMDWLNNHIWPAESEWVSQEFVYEGSLLAMAEMVRCGTTCFNDMYFFLGATAQAAEQIGIRAHIGMTIMEVPTPWAKTADEYFRKAMDFYQQYQNHKTITPTLAPHSTYTVSRKNLEKIKKIADEHHLKINIHLQEAPSEISHSLEKYQQRPLQVLHEIGLVSQDLIAIHMTQLNEADLALLQQTKPNIVHCPESNLKLASGLCPVEVLTKLGINVALGTDGAASNNDLDMLSEMRTAALLGKMIANDPKAISAEKALHMASLHGAKALGIDHLTGSLAPNKSADFIAIDLEQIETQPVYCPLSQIIYAASRNQVTDVWVCGKQLLKDRQLLTIDEQALIKKAKIWRKKIKT